MVQQEEKSKRMSEWDRASEWKSACACACVCVSARTQFSRFILHMLSDMNQLKYKEKKMSYALEYTKLTNCTNKTHL